MTKRINRVIRVPVNRTRVVAAKLRHDQPWLRNFVQRVTQYAVKTGCLKHQPCTFCGNPKSQAYHPRYDDPLRIRWLCNRCRPIYHYRLLRALKSVTEGEPAQLELFPTFWSRKVRSHNSDAQRCA
jgi:hypothetical protein